MADDTTRFWANVDKAGPVAPSMASPCWLWTGHIEATGYGRIKVRRAKKMAHRMAYEFAAGPIPDGLQIDHLCRTRACVNPEHLEPVTPHENTRRGLQPITVRGTGNTHAKLTEQQALAIRADTRHQRVIARDYGVSQSTVSSIKNLKNWGWLSASEAA